MKRWMLRHGEHGVPDTDAAAKFPVLGEGTPEQLALANRLAVPPSLVELLERRGFRSLEAMNEFLSPLLRYLAPLESWPGLEKAADVLAEAIREGREVLVWGDYDVDGVTSTTLCMDVLRYHRIPARIHLPDRQKEGYGLNGTSLKRLCAAYPQGGKEVVLLTVDCGISDVEAVAVARNLGLIVVISDHHMPPDILPDAHALCNPRLHADSPCPSLAGVGVAFFLMAALNKRLAAWRKVPPLDMRGVLDLVALGTLADMVSLTGQNRILTKNGLLKIAEAARPGLAELKDVSGYDRMATLGAGQVVFNLAPKINAAGRIGAAEDAFRLLSGQYNEPISDLARRLDELNTQRRSEEEKIFLEAREQAEKLLAARPELTALVVYAPEWHPGIIGIVASRLVEAYNRPTLVLCRVVGEGGKAILKGSGRSIPEFDLHAGLVSCSDLFLGYGGHRQAAGVSMDGANLEAFRERFHRVVSDTVGAEVLRPRLMLDGELPFSLASDFTFLKSLELMQPFGIGNPEPVFVSNRLVVHGVRFFGFKREHVSLRVQEIASGISLQAKLWRQAAAFSTVRSGQHLRLAFSPSINRYNGVASVELTVKDWKLDE